MQQVTNNEGKKIMIPSSLYNQLLQDKESGVSFVIISDAQNQPHVINVENIS